MSLFLKTKRQLVQATATVGLNTNFFSVVSERICLPVLNCEACAVAWFGCPIGMMQASIAFMEFPLLVIVTLIAFGILFGRFLCGWACPTGFIQDMLHKIPSPKFKIPRFMTWFKYAVLLFAVMLIPFFFGDVLERPYCEVCPTAAIQVVIPTMIQSNDFTIDIHRGLKLGVLIGFLVFTIGHHRFFCKVICPLGAMMSLTNKLSMFAIRLNPSDIKLRHILGRATRTIRADRCSLYLFDKKRQEIFTKIAQNLEVEEIRLPSGVGFCGYVAKTGEVLNVPNAYSDPRFAPDVDAQTGYRTESVLTVPIWDSEKSIVGVLQALNHRNGAFTKEDETKLIEIASEMADIIWKAKTCVRCRKCDRTCPMDVPVMNSQEKERPVNRHSECIECLTCEDNCPTSAIANNSRIIRA